MSSMGIGQGLAEGIRTGGAFALKGMEIGQQNQRYKQYNDTLLRQMDMNLEWQRGIDSLPPSYHEEDEANAAAATRPAIPSSTPIVTPGPLGIPQTRFETGRPVQPMPAAPTAGSPGALSLVPPTMGYMGRPPRMRRRY